MQNQREKTEILSTPFAYPVNTSIFTTPGLPRPNLRRAMKAFVTYSVML
jgi:hypothetical protein